MGLAGAFATGLTTSAFFGMGPIFAGGIGLSETGIASFMSATILGALVLQWPLGWLSDVVDRRFVIISCSIVATVAAGVVSLTAPGGSFHLVLALASLHGGTMIPLYALSVAHVNDRIEAQELVPAASGLVMTAGVGASIGPFAASLVVGQLGPEGLFVFSGDALAVFVIFALFRVPRGAATPQEIKQTFVVAPRTSHAALQMHKHHRGPGPGPRAPA